jgi:hypothetical protein
MLHYEDHIEEYHFLHPVNKISIQKINLQNIYNYLSLFQSQEEQETPNSLHGICVRFIW